MSAPRARLWLGAFTGFYKPAFGEELGRLDTLSLFLYSARSVILIISIQAAVIAGLLAAVAGHFQWIDFIAVLAGFVSAHMLSNLSNDYFDFKHGRDTPDSPRMQYTIHPLASGLLGRHRLVAGIAVLGAIGLATMLYFIIHRGWIAAAFAGAGIATMFLYDAGKTPLKSRGLGELAVLIVWGPLMIGGGFTMITGQLSPNSFLASIPYGLGVMTILVGKHIDQIPFDSRHDIRTLPVLIGAREARMLNIVALASIYAIIAVLIAFGRLTPFAGIVAISLPRAARAMKRLSHKTPTNAPDGYAGWPLWFHRICLEHNRLFGWAYITGLAAAVAWARFHSPER